MVDMDRDIMPIRKKLGDSISYEHIENAFNRYVDELISHIDNFFNRDLQGVFNTGIKADIKENDREYIIEAEMPGVNKEDIQVELIDDKLTISATMDEDEDIEGENYIRKERRLGSVSRTFSVQGIINEEVRAEYKNGVLKIILPKDESTINRGKYIQIE